MKQLRFTIYSTVLLWLLNGTITVGGAIYLGAGISNINGVVGTLFILMGAYFYWRGKVLLELLTKIHTMSCPKLRKKFMILEIGFNMGFLFLGVVASSAIISRVFVEGYPVFD